MKRERGRGRRQQRRVGSSQAIVLAAMSAFLMVASAAQGSDQNGKLTEEFHQVYPFSAQGRIQSRISTAQSI
jgi:hypothetical protein